MNNATAILLGALLLGLLAGDWLLNGAEGLTFVGRRLIELIEYLAFWR